MLSTLQHREATEKRELEKLPKYKMSLLFGLYDALIKNNNNHATRLTSFDCLADLQLPPCAH